jgi:hypothetical protein
MRSLALIFISFSIALSVNAQYRKLPLDTNHYWQQVYGRVGSFPQDFMKCSYVLKVQRDSVWNSLVFKFVRSKNHSCTNGNSYSEAALIREDTLRRIVTKVVNQQEKILFNKNVGDTALMLSPVGMATYTLTSKDSVLFSDGFYHKRFFFNQSLAGPVLYEGVGSSAGLLRSWDTDFEQYYDLLCVGRTQPNLSIYSSEGAGKSCPNITAISEKYIKGKTISLFPTPSTDYFNISTENSIINSVKVKNMLGQTVLELEDLSTNHTQINIKDLPPGIFLVNINCAGSIITKRLLKTGQ